MDKQERQNAVNEGQQSEVQMEPTPLSLAPSHKKLIIGIVAVFVLIIAGIAGAYFILQPKAQPVDDTQQITSSDGGELNSATNERAGWGKKRASFTGNP